jgi:hypothetical protein
MNQWKRYILVMKYPDMNIDPDLSLKNLVYGSAHDIYEEDLSKLQASV